VERTRWTDERIDDMVLRLEGGLADVREEIRALRQENREDSRSTRDDIRSIREDLSAFQRQVAQIGWGLVGALLVALLTLLISSI
jgi:hypothetical protein